MMDKTYRLNGEESVPILKAIANSQRMRILSLLSSGRLSVQELMEALQLGRTTILSHINQLEKAGFIKTVYSTGSKGGKRICESVYDAVDIRLNPRAEDEKKQYRYTKEIEPGNYFDCQVTKPCGLGMKSGPIGQWDTVDTFYRPDRVYASLLWHGTGYVTYKFPLPSHVKREEIVGLQISLEINSLKNIILPKLQQREDRIERLTPGQTQIYIKVNNTMVGEKQLVVTEEHNKGTYTPSWWNGLKSGYLLDIVVKKNGTWINQVKVSEKGIEDIHLSKIISVEIGVQADALFQSGFILFGRDFGNHPQGIIFHIL